MDDQGHVAVLRVSKPMLSPFLGFLPSYPTLCDFLVTGLVGERTGAEVLNHNVSWCQAGCPASAHVARQFQKG